ncbi:MAG: CoA transferase [Phenylobacterium sp.]|uniref:CaiB/BaiF CoA transferase family protein n=1 Tax=Phenylobacterium sp. TaxID=1871053 RepID=UPI0025E4F61D|nr:CoA transferase [Phenylobacterium sp.]MCA3730582.1 CoA transferase [Phenylobacterium sp.]MCA3737281.1 CoA transferase [Phenylobacterium sp.]MCA4916254.1 CoA transferase [Phenylobacterium sp.]
MPDHAPKGPLSDLRVVEMGTLIAGPFCGQVLGDFGADVVKIEDPGKGDPMRQWGRSLPKGLSPWWPVIGRNKRSVALDLRQPEGRELALALIDQADVLIENFRPGALEKWGMGYEVLAARNPRLVMARVSGFGQTGPYSQRAGYGLIGEAMGGLRYVTGEPDRPPARAGISIGDSLTALHAVIGVMMALHHREHTGRGQMIDAALYESVLSVMENLVTEYDLTGYVRERSGSILPGIAPSNVYPCANGESLLIGGNGDAVFARLAATMGREDLAADPRFATHAARGENQAELDALVSNWTRNWPLPELLALLEANGVPCGRIFRAPDMLEDPQFAARQSIVEVDHPVFGKVKMQNAFPRLSETPGGVRWPGPALGEHTREVLEGLGVDAARLADLAARKVTALP